MRLKTKIENLIRKISDRFTGNGLMQDENQAVGERYITKGLPELIRQSGAEGIVLLKNNGVLPLENKKRVAVFGRCQINYFYVGYGSGGNINAPYKISLDDALLEAEKDGYILLDKEVREEYVKWTKNPDNQPSDGWWGHWPISYEEMPLDKKLVEKSAKTNDVALVVIGRAAGEDRENKLEKGSYYLTDKEEDMLDKVCAEFSQVVVLIDAGNVIDMSWQNKYKDKISSILYAWQGGMESGNSVVDVLTGKVCACGKLTDTIAVDYESYPSAKNFGGLEYNNYREDIFVGYRYFETFAKEKVLYPFGYGLSYTDFEIKVQSFARTKSKIKISLVIKNAGKRDGKEIVQVYVKAPQGRLGKASRVLAAFKKTKLLKAGDSQNIDIEFSDYDFASFDDYLDSETKDCFILEKGKYTVFVGNSVRAELRAGEFEIEKDEVLSKLNSVCQVKEPFMRIKAKCIDGQIMAVEEEVPKDDYSLKERIQTALPKSIGPKEYKGQKFEDVLSKKITLDEFVSVLSNDELQALTRGYGAMNAPQGVKGNAGAYGGIIPSLEEKGVKAAITTDGPAGIRIQYYTALLPCGTALASTWNTELVEKLYAKVGEEMEYYKSDILLGAGMNIHRNPLCGRNFEYYSEDPLISGKMAAAFVNGIQSQGKGACPKHFACNNQEVKRNRNDSRLSQRALREIYLKGFEICVKESKPINIMTSYNKINGVWSHYNYDLATMVLREEWQYEGTVITDWWMRRSKSPEFEKIEDNAYRIRAQVDVLMPGDMKYVTKGYKKDKKLIKSIGKKDMITRGEMERCAKNTLKTLIWLDEKSKEKNLF